MIKGILKKVVDTPTKPLFKFELSAEAALHNMKLLQSNGNSIHAFIKNHQGSIVSPGSEFRPVNVLEPLFLHHRNWASIQKNLLEGSHWPLHPIPNAD